MAKPPEEIPPLYPSGDFTKAPPDEALLDAEEARMLHQLGAEDTSFAALRAQTQSRLHALRSSLEFKVDHLASGAHQLAQRVDTATREADRVLGLTARRLREREERERAAAGTRDVPVMEVLRSLGRILPEEGGGG